MTHWIYSAIVGLVIGPIARFLFPRAFHPLAEIILRSLASPIRHRPPLFEHLVQGPKQHDFKKPMQENEKKYRRDCFL